MPCIALGLTLATILSWTSMGYWGYNHNYKDPTGKYIAVVESEYVEGRGSVPYRLTVHHMDGGRIEQVCAEMLSGEPVGTEKE